MIIPELKSPMVKAACKRYRVKEFFVRWMWRLAAFLEIEILDFLVMSNHYHPLVRVPGVVKLGDNELLEKL